MHYHYVGTFHIIQLSIPIEQNVYISYSLAVFMGVGNIGEVCLMSLNCLCVFREDKGGRNNMKISLVKDHFHSIVELEYFSIRNV